MVRGVAAHSLIQDIKELVEHVLAEGLGRLRRLVVGHGGEERAVSPGQAGRGVSEPTQERRERASVMLGSCSQRSLVRNLFE